MLRFPRGFTLIELLVVVTIIVVLLALLTPALDKAMYQADLAACMAQLRGIASSAQIYAGSHRRFYPNRPSIDTGYWNRPTNLSDTVVDDRAVLAGFFDMKSLVDPLCEAVDLSGSRSGVHVFSSYNLWFGVSYIDEGRQYAGIKRLGDRLSFRDRQSGTVYRFSILAGDYDSIYEYGSYGVFSSHPDRGGKLQAVAGEGTNASGLGTVPVPAGSSYGSDVYTLSRWQALGDPARGDSDLNFVYADGSVRRFDEVVWDDWRTDNARMYNLPVQARGGTLGSGYPLYWDHIPLR
jgi:prepilin-type N-terminal cleavage/methylation domain-containing protein